MSFLKLILFSYLPEFIWSHLSTQVFFILRGRFYSNFRMFFRFQDRAGRGHLTLMAKCGALLIQTSQWYNIYFVLITDSRHARCDLKRLKNIHIFTR